MMSFKDLDSKIIWSHIDNSIMSHIISCSYIYTVSQSVSQYFGLINNQLLLNSKQYYKIKVTGEDKDIDMNKCSVLSMLTL